MLSSYSQIFFLKTKSVFFPLFFGIEAKEQNYSTKLLEIEISFSSLCCPPLCFSFERRVERREKEREKESFCSCCGRVVGMSFTITTTTALNTHGLRMQNSSTLVGKRIGQKRGTFVNENRNTKARNGSRGIPIKAAKQGGGSGTRPYTLRSGDTLESIASKRKLNVETLRNMNKKIGSGTPKIGQTILIPSGALSARDLEIINGIAKINAPVSYTHLTLPTKA